MKFKVAVTEVAVEKRPRVKRESKQMWVAGDILEFMEKKEASKNIVMKKKTPLHKETR